MNFKRNNGAYIIIRYMCVMYTVYIIFISTYKMCLVKSHKIIMPTISITILTNLYTIGRY